MKGIQAKNLCGLAGGKIASTHKRPLTLDAGRVKNATVIDRRYPNE
jgi:hypothetical protein